MHGQQHVVTTTQHVAGQVGTAQQVVGHAVAHVVGHEQQHAAVVQLVHWALVVAAHVVLAVVAAHCADTFIDVNSESATTNAITARNTFFTFSPPVFCI